MLKDITLGQYFPGTSIIHRMDPRIKIVSVFLLITAIFLANNYVSYVALILFVALIVALSRIHLRTILKSIKPVIFILIFTAMINLFFTSGDHLIFSLGFVHIYWEGVSYAILMALRIVCLIVGTFVLLTYTTSPVALTDAIERLLSPFQKLGLPTHEFSMMMTIALRFIPTLIEETEKIMNAQKARGADFETGSLVKRAKALVPILIPLFVSAFRRADELAAAMECRLYHGGEGRTRMKVLKCTASDLASLCVFLLFIGLIVAINYCFPKVL